MAIVISTKLNYKMIAHDLLTNGVKDLPNWPKEEFVIVCQYDFGVCRRTAEKAYEAYHDLLKKQREE